MKIDLDEYGCCLSETCLFNRECAQHTTGGEYRDETGFTPELYRCEADYYCTTYDRSGVVGIGYGVLNGASHPSNYKDLGVGFCPKVKIKDDLLFHLRNLIGEAGK